jgi:hypothetical protein
MESHQLGLAYKTFLETLTPSGVGGVARLVAPDVRFRDPIHDLRGVDNLRRVYAGLFEVVDDPQFVVTDCATTGTVSFLRWHFTCRPRLFGKGHPWLLDAVTVVQADAHGRIADLVDYWDAGQYMYERFRVIGPVFRYFRKRRNRVR